MRDAPNHQFSPLGDYCLYSYVKPMSRLPHPLLLAQHLTNWAVRLASAEETRKGYSVFVSDQGRNNVTFAINLPGSPSGDNQDIFYHLTGPIDNSWIGQTQRMVET